MSKKTECNIAIDTIFYMFKIKTPIDWYCNFVHLLPGTCGTIIKKLKSKVLCENSFFPLFDKHVMIIHMMSHVIKTPSFCTFLFNPNIALLSFSVEKTSLKITRKLCGNKHESTFITIHHQYMSKVYFDNFIYYRMA